MKDLICVRGTGQPLQVFIANSVRLFDDPNFEDKTYDDYILSIADTDEIRATAAYKDWSLEELTYVQSFSGQWIITSKEYAALVNIILTTTYQDILSGPEFKEVRAMLIPFAKAYLSRATHFSQSRRITFEV